MRPTSETIVNHMFSQWIQSYEGPAAPDEPVGERAPLEMRTRPFIRTLEFLWQEGHTAHATGAEAEAKAIEMVNVYAEFAEDIAAMPVIVGRKSAVKSFAGANRVHHRGHDGRPARAAGGHPRTTSAELCQGV